MKRRVVLISCALGIWLLALVAGFGGQVIYSAGSGEVKQSPRAWPATTDVARSDALPTLLVFLHPKCPCSRATIEQLQRTLVGRWESIEVRAIFVLPPGVEPGWEEDSLLRQVRLMPHASIVLDHGGNEAKLFGAETSGFVLYYDTDGRLRFHGGITPSRGHAGDSNGSVVIQQLVTGRTPTMDNTRVFGCPLFDAKNRPCCELSETERIEPDHLSACTRQL